jgi:Tryptophan halogenase
VKKIVILGGGTAGWLSALFLKRAYKDIDVTVVEDPSRPPIIAGESGTSTLIQLFKFLEIDLKDWLQQVNATPKMGGKFTDWGGIGTEFIHALQTELIPDNLEDSFTKNNIRNLSVQDLLLKTNHFHDKEIFLRTLIANDIALSDAFFAGEFIKQNKVPDGNRSPFNIGCMWHFESRDNAAYMKSLGISRGINLVEDQYTHSQQDENGYITKLVLASGKELDGDWFFDCSGFVSLLLGKVLEEPIVDFSDYFPARNVIAWWDKTEYQVTTNARAMKYGWSWNINLQHRSGNGYIYDPDHLSYDQALEEVHSRFGSHIEPIAKLSINPGMMKTFIKKNVIGVGLSTGFMEPLEANGVAVIIETLGILNNNWSPEATYEENFTTMNTRLWESVVDIRDFLCLHYRGHRKDTEFWKSHAYDSFRIPYSLKEKLNIWKGYYENDRAQLKLQGYSPSAWLTVVQGLNLFDTSSLKKYHAHILKQGKELNQKYRLMYEDYVKLYPSINEWVNLNKVEK